MVKEGRIISRGGDLMYNPQLETFIRVADAGSFNKAAEQSFITPTAVIKQINLLLGRDWCQIVCTDAQGIASDKSGYLSLSGCKIYYRVLQGFCDKGEKCHAGGRICNPHRNVSNDAGADSSGSRFAVLCPSITDWQRRTSLRWKICMGRI